MTGLGSQIDLSAIGNGDGLMSETDPESWHLRSETLDELNRVAGILGNAWAGGNHESFERNFGCFLGCHLVVADHQRLSPEFTQVLNEVVGERVVVVEDEDKHGNQTLDVRRQTPDARRQPGD
jgi:hypothetical protein